MMFDECKQVDADFCFCDYEYDPDKISTDSATSYASDLYIKDTNGNFFSYSSLVGSLIVK